ncbi:MULTISPECIES: transposase family protein [Spirulina sp. CCY15215]|uniref:helix-turn-helix domain-containing protein n=1 Tax=Spirulina sp. CCY15215 TaxID=2767591 RepID=UPI00194F0E88|nr:transposase family protein [Spirulina major]
MVVIATQKDSLTTKLRQTLTENISEIQETDRAELSLCNLSFQSKVYPERHIWIETDCNEIAIDLENWQDENEWDNAIARVRVDSLEDAIELVKDWIIQPELNHYYNLNKRYEKVWNIRHFRSQIAKAIENNDLEVQRILGLTNDQFSNLLVQAEQQKKENRQIILTPTEQLILTLFYSHYTLSFKTLGLLFGVSGSTARKWYKYWIDFLEKQIQSSSQEIKKTGEEWIREVLEPIYQKELKTA